MQNSGKMLIQKDIISEKVYTKYHCTRYSKVYKNLEAVTNFSLQFKTSDASTWLHTLKKIITWFCFVITKVLKTLTVVSGISAWIKSFIKAGIYEQFRKALSGVGISFGVSFVAGLLLSD